MKYFYLILIVCVIALAIIEVRKGFPGAGKALPPQPQGLTRPPHARRFTQPLAATRTAVISEKPIKRRQKLWALATTGLLTIINRQRHDLLSGGMLTAVYVGGCQQMLHDAWGVTDRSSLLKTLTWLETEGHRAEFTRIGAHISS